MGDGSAIGGWILAAAIVTVLAGGAHAATGSGGSGGSGGTGGAGGTARPTAGASRSPSTPGSRPASPGATTTTAAAAPCTRASRRLSADRGHYKILPVAADGSPDCRLQLGDRGRPVTVLQQALLMCSNRGVRVDGTFSQDTRGALSRDQARQLGVTPTGVYDPRTARVFAWPWYDSTTGKFTGRCGQVADRAL
jgi:hypothetical protein